MGNDVFQLTDDKHTMLAELSERNGLSKMSLIELLVSQAHALNWTVLSPISVSVPLVNEQIDYELLKIALYNEQFIDICNVIDKEKVTTWLGLGRIGATKLGMYKGIGDWTLKSIRFLLKEQNVILGR